MTYWVISAVVFGSVFAVADGRLRRKTPPGGSRIAAWVTAACALAAGIAAILLWPPADGRVYGAFLLMATVIGATSGGVMVTERFVNNSPGDRPTLEIAAGIVGFIGGAIVGAFIGLIVLSLTGPQIG